MYSDTVQDKQKIDDVIDSILILLGQAGYTMDDMLDRWRELYDNPEIATDSYEATHHK